MIDPAPAHEGAAGVAPPLRWALFGASTIARERMVPAIRAGGGAIVAVLSRDAERATAFAASQGIPVGTTDPDLALAAAEAVYVSGVNADHGRLSLRALAAGRHVLCEKPLALTLDEADAMIAAAAADGRVLAVNHHLRHNAVHRAIRRLVAEGAIGAVRAASITNAGWLPGALRTWRLEGAGAGIALDKTVHDIDLLRFLIADDPVAVIARARPLPAPQAIMAVVEFRAGVTAQLYDDFNARVARTRLELIGSAGRLVASDCLSGRPAGDLVVETAAGASTPALVHGDPYAAVVRDLHAAVAHGTPPAASGADGRAALATALAAMRAAETGTRVVVEGAG